MKTQYVVTGAAGYLGGVLVGMLVEQGDAVRALVLPHDDATALADLPVEIVRGDVRDTAALARLLADLPPGSVVLHVASIVTVATKRIPLVEEVNIQGTRNIIACCQTAKARLVYVSSTDAIPLPPGGGRVAEVQRFDPDAVTGLYAFTKATASQAVLCAAKEGLSAAIVHPTVLIGAGDYAKGVVTQMLCLYLRHPWLPCVRGGYDFVDVRDVAAGILAAARDKRSGECYILSNRYLSMKDILNQLLQLRGKRPIRLVAPMPVVKFFIGCMEVVYKLRRKMPPFTRYALRVLVCGARFDHTKANRQLDYAPRDIGETLRDTAAFLEERGWI